MPWFGTGLIYLCNIIQKHNAMNTENSIAFISSLISSDSSFKALADMMDDMDLEIMGVNLA